MLNRIKKKQGLAASVFMLIVTFYAMVNSDGPVERPLSIVCFSVFVVFTLVILFAKPRQQKRP